MSNWPLHKFHGGILLAENKHQSTATQIAVAPVPPRLFVPTLQHSGQPAEPCVSVGDYVYKGQLIAHKSGAISAAVHAPSSGTITGIGNRPYPHASGEQFQAIEIETDGLDQWQQPLQQRDMAQLSNTEIFEAIQAAGISGLGGAGFPTDIKLSGLIMDGIEYLIINGTECEPYITADDMLMRERSNEILQGVDILVRLTSPRNVLIAIEDNKPLAIAAMREQLGPRDYKIVTIPTLYPSGGERQLIKILTGQEVPSGQLPINLGMLCQNVGTCTAIYQAVVHGRPLISRITTLTGAALQQPMNIECLFGTPIQELLKLAHWQPDRHGKIVVGGPMMGFLLKDALAPVIKTTNCVIAATSQELPDPEPALPCIRCGECEQVCPSNLLPQQLLYFANGQQHEQLMDHNLFDCIECGCCSYVCSSKIPLVQYYRAAKAEIRTLQHKQSKSELARQRFESRQQRLRLEEEQKITERKAREERLARIKAAKAQTAPQPAATAASADEIKKLKIAASMAKVALRKASKQLEQHGTDELQQQVARLEEAAAQAQRELEQAQQAVDTALPTPAVAGADNAASALKKAKIKLAMSKAALKKAQRAQADAAQIDALEQEVRLAEQNLAQTGATTD